jgi:hypothetical protein
VSSHLAARTLKSPAGKVKERRLKHSAQNGAVANRQRLAAVSTIQTSGNLKQTAGKRRIGYLAGAHDDSEQDPTPPLQGCAKPEGT